MLLSIQGLGRFLASRLLGGSANALFLGFLLALSLAMPPAEGEGFSSMGAKPVEQVRGWAVVNLIRFSYWPDSAYASASEPTRVCAPPGLLTLPSTNDGSRGDPTFLHGRQVMLAEIKDYSDVAHCHVIYFSDVDIGDFKILCEELRGQPVAFVSDVPGFASIGGSFELVIDGDYAFFRFNRATLMESGIDLAQALMRMGSMPSHEGGAL